MKNIFSKIQNNKTLFTIFMIFALAMFLIITSDIGLFNNHLSGLLQIMLRLFDRIYNYTYWGRQAIGELIWLLLLIPVLLLFKNKYIFTQKRDSFISTLKMAWPLVIYTILLMLLMIAYNGMTINSINFYEIISLLFFTTFVGFFEELLCRGWILNEFTERFANNRKNVLYCIVTSAFIFGFIHIVNAFVTSQSLPLTFVQILNAIIIGIAYGAIYYRSKNIFATIFLHAFWDFALLLSELNKASICVIANVEPMPTYMIFLLLIAVIIIAIPAICTSILLLGKKDINDSLPEESRVEYSENEYQKDKKRKSIFRTIAIAYLVIFAAIVSFSYRYKSMIPLETDNCLSYETLKAGDGNLIYSNVTSYDIQTVNQSFNIKLNDNKLIFTDNQTNDALQVDDYIYTKLIVINNNNEYQIFISRLNEDYENVVYYYSINYYNVLNENYLEGIISNFNQLLLPDIENIGIYHDINYNYDYPLFISTIGKKYILNRDNNIYILD